MVLDLYARRVVGWNISETPDTNLVTQAFCRAVETRRSVGGLLFPSDQGVQYRSKGSQQYLKRYQNRQNMSRKGKCWDNAPMERVFPSLKTEWIPQQDYRSLPETMREIGEYLMGYYNRVRLHSYNDDVTPKKREYLWQPPKLVSKNT